MIPAFIEPHDVKDTRTSLEMTCHYIYWSPCFVYYFKKFHLFSLICVCHFKTDSNVDYYQPED